MKIVCMLYGGPERTIIDGKGKKWRFEDHHYCGPIVLTGKTGEIAENQPPENSPFWFAVNLWYAQGKRTKDPRTGEIWCVWDKPTMRKMRRVSDHVTINRGNNMSEDKKESGKERMVEILKSHGIEMIVGGCGCCRSPWVTFKYNGEVILDDDDCAFDMGK